MEESEVRVVEIEDESITVTPEVDPLASLSIRTTQVKDLLVQNVDKLLSREEKLLKLADRSEQLQGSAFRCTTRRVAWSYWCQDKKLLFLILAAVIVIILVILVVTGVIPIGSNNNP